MNSPGEDIAVLMLGYEEQMLKMLREANPGLQRRFSPESDFRFEDFSDDQLEELLHRTAASAGLRWSKRAVRKAALNLLIKERIQPNFGNAGSVNSLMGRVKMAVAARGDAREIVLEDLGLDASAAGGSAQTAALLEEVQADMAKLFKGEHLQKHFSQLAARLASLEKDGEFDPSRPAAKVGSYVFVGNPGTGKTTFAKVLAKFLRAKGVLVSHQFKDESALNLQGEFLGETKGKVNRLMASAPGGMVFIDEAYNLGGGRGGGGRGTLYAQEAVDQLTYCMTEDSHKDRTIVVVAGYEREMDAMFSGANAGFRSRFKQRVVFPDWDAADVVEYLSRRCAERGRLLTEGAKQLLLSSLEQVRRRPGWANARDAEWVYDELSGVRDIRCSEEQTEEEARPTFTRADAKQAMANFDRLRPPDPLANKRGGPDGLDAEAGADDGPPVQEAEPPPQEEVEVEERFEELCVNADDDDGPPKGPSVAAALQEACVELGYDADNQKRKELIGKLHGCEGDKDFPGDILALVIAKTSKKKHEVLDELREQVTAVLEAMREAIHQAEQEQYKKDAPIREKLKEMALCPAGFDWHRDGCGWRCNGGSHYMSNEDLGF